MNTYSIIPIRYPCLRRPDGTIVSGYVETRESALSMCNDLFPSTLHPERCMTCLPKWEQRTDKPEGLDIKMWLYLQSSFLEIGDKNQISSRQVPSLILAQHDNHLKIQYWRVDRSGQ